jgi:hypothetical protein
MKPQNGNDKCNLTRVTPSGANDAHYHSSSSLVIDGGADSGRANAEHRSSSSSRKRRHDQYIEEGFDILPDLPAAYERESREMMPPPQIPSSWCKDKSGGPSYQAPAPPQSRRLSRWSEDQCTRRSGPEVRLYGDGEWKPTQPATRDQRSQCLSRDGSQYRMSGALLPTDDKDQQQKSNSSRNILPPNQSSFNQPQRPLSQSVPFLQPIHRPKAVHQQHTSGDSRYDERDYVLAPGDGRYVNPHVTDNRQPTSTIPRAFTMRQPLVVPPSSRAGRYFTDSGYMSNVDLHARRPPNDDDYFIHAIAPASQRRSFEPVFHTAMQRESPFFRRDPEIQFHQKSKRHNTTQLQPEQLVPDARLFRMQPPSPMGQMGRSLNALSFINSPLTSKNRPIFEREIRPYSGVNHHNEPQYFTRVEESYREQPQSRIHHARHSSAVPSRRSFVRDNDMKLLGAIRGAKSGTTNIVPSVLPFSRNRGAFSSAGIGRSAR